MAFRNNPYSWCAVGLLAAMGCVRSAQHQKDIGETGEYGTPGFTEYSDSNLDANLQPKKKVLVLPFWNDTPIQDAELGAYAAALLRNEMKQTRRVLIPSDLETSLSTEDFVSGEKIKVAQLIREGRRLGVGIVVVGRIARLSYRSRGEEVGILRQRQSQASVQVELKVFDIAGGREVGTLGRGGSAGSQAYVAAEDENFESQTYRKELGGMALKDSVVRLSPEVLRMVEKLTWQGKIVKVLGNKVFINAGRKSGIMAGDILKVLKDGEDVYDPSSQAYLGKTPGQEKGTLEVVGFLGEGKEQDAAIGEIHSGGNFLEGDTVQLY